MRARNYLFESGLVTKEISSQGKEDLNKLLSIIRKKLMSVTDAYIEAYRIGEASNICISFKGQNQQTFTVIFTVCGLYQPEGSLNIKYDTAEYYVYDTVDVLLMILYLLTDLELMITGSKDQFSYHCKH